MHSENLRYEDATGAFEQPSDQSDGFKARKKLFLNEDASEFSTDWIQFSGRLHFDLESLPTGILPGVQIGISLEYSSDDFRLIRTETTESYPKINDIVMEIGYVSVNTSIFSDY